MKYRVRTDGTGRNTLSAEWLNGKKVMSASVHLDFEDMDTNKAIEALYRVNQKRLTKLTKPQNWESIRGTGK